VALVFELTVPTERPRRLSAKLVPAFVDRVVSRSQHGGSPTGLTLLNEYLRNKGREFLLQNELHISVRLIALTNCMYLYT
jgi:hypothetical protein